MTFRFRKHPQTPLAPLGDSDRPREGSAPSKYYQERAYSRSEKYLQPPSEFCQTETKPSHVSDKWRNIDSYYYESNSKLRTVVPVPVEVRRSKSPRRYLLTENSKRHLSPSRPNADYYQDMQNGQRYDKRQVSPRRQVVGRQKANSSYRSGSVQRARPSQVIKISTEPPDARISILKNYHEQIDEKEESGFSEQQLGIQSEEYIKSPRQLSVREMMMKSDKIAKEIIAKHHIPIDKELEPIFMKQMKQSAGSSKQLPQELYELRRFEQNMLGKGYKKYF